MIWTVAATMGMGIALSMSACGGGEPQEDQDASSDGASHVNPTAIRTGPLGGGASISCVETYSPAALTHRMFAFDGVVIDIGPSISDRGNRGDLSLPGVTFQVAEWFEGGDLPTVTVDLQAPERSFEIGSRLLVSGESRWGEADLGDAIAWPCGFTRYYDAKTARAWANAF